MQSNLIVLKFEPVVGKLRIGKMLSCCPIKSFYEVLCSFTSVHFLKRNNDSAVPHNAGARLAKLSAL